MKNVRAILCRRAVFAGMVLGLSAGASRAQTYFNGFGTGGNTTNFSGSGSVASWIYWYGAPGNGLPMTNDVSLDVFNDPNSGSLQVVSLFDAGPAQNVFFGTFGNGDPYDFSTELNFNLVGSITFYLRMAPGTPPRTNAFGVPLDFGTIGVGIVTANYVYEQFGAPTIPLTASNAWVRFMVPVDYSQPNISDVPGIAFSINNYANVYPTFFMTNYIDDLSVFVRNEVHPVLLPPQKAVSGLNVIDSIGGVNGQSNREQICTVADTGYTFAGRPSVTYSWDTTVFPTGTGAAGWQQHFFIVNGAPGPSDQEADYNLPDVFWINVQQSDAGNATMNFRYKTNEAGGNGMLFNTTSPTDAVNNPNGWPIEPVATLAAPAGATGTWSVTVANTTNITISGPGGVSTNFNIDPAAAALFADPCTLILGGQPNVSTAGGKYSVYGRFSATGCATPISDNFLADTTLNTALWRNLSSDTNGIYLVPPTAAFWLRQELQNDVDGWALQSKTDFASPGGWIDQPTLPGIQVTGIYQYPVNSNQLASPTQGYFQLIKRQFTQLQVLLAGETNAPGTLTGKTGAPRPVSETADSGQVNVTINAVDPTFHIMPGISDIVNVTSSADPDTIEPSPAPLVNGSLRTAVAFISTGNYTITAGDTTDTNIIAGTSSSVSITP